MNAGIFLKSTALLKETFFDEAVIFITEYNEKGAMGFVVNKLFPRKFNELEEFKKSIPFPLYDGGPVGREHLYFVHRRPDVIKDGILVTDNIYFGGDFAEAVGHINNKTITEIDIKLFIGYCGWDHREIEEEVEEGSWLVLKEGRLF